MRVVEAIRPPMAVPHHPEVTAVTVVVTVVPVPRMPVTVESPIVVFAGVTLVDTVGVIAVNRPHEADLGQGETEKMTV